MSIRAEKTITPDLLRQWALPNPGDGGSKYDRGQVVVIGGAAAAPGAAILAGIAALRMGAGRLTLAVEATVAPHVAVAVWESGVISLAPGTRLQEAADELAAANCVLVGPGLTGADSTRRLVAALPALVSADATVVLDAFALGIASQVPEAVAAWSGRLVFTPNTGEAARLLDRELTDDSDPDSLAGEVREIAERYGAVVSCQGFVASPAGDLWTVGTGTIGLATSGSGDVLAGAIAGLCARGAEPAQAAVWATHAHAAAGDRLAVQVGPLGFLAGELLEQLPRVLVEIGAPS